MKLENVGEVIAIRRFRLRDESQTLETGKEVLLQLGKPQRSPDSPAVEEWFCPFQIIGIGDERVRYAAGVDAFQAIQLAFKLIGATIGRLGQQSNGRLRWDYDDEGGFGFPEG